MPAEALIAGSVDEVAEQFPNFEEIGYTEILVRHLTNDQPKVLDRWNNWERYARRWPELAQKGGSPMLELSEFQASPEELEDYYAQLRAQHVTPARIGGGISLEP